MRMTASPSKLVQLLRAMGIALLASPFVISLSTAVLDPPNDSTAQEYASWRSVTVPTVFRFYLLSAFLYVAGFCITYLVVRRQVYPAKARALWWCSLVAGAFSALFVPIGTVLALPCLVTLFRRRSLYFRVDGQAASSYEGSSGKS